MLKGSIECKSKCNSLSNSMATFRVICLFLSVFLISQIALTQSTDSLLQSLRKIENPIPTIDEAEKLLQEHEDDLDFSIEVAKIALRQADFLGNKNAIARYLLTLSKLHFLANDHERAMIYMKLYHVRQENALDVLLLEKNITISQLDSLMNVTNSDLSNRDEKITQLGQQNRSVLNGLKIAGGLALVVLAMGIYGYRAKTRNGKKEPTKRKIKIKSSFEKGSNSQSPQSNEHIATILFSPKPFENVLKDGFSLDLPKNKVGGDFWYAKTYGRQKLLVITDCPGHGTQGQLISLLVQQQLDDILKDDTPPPLNLIPTLLEERLENYVEKVQELKAGISMVALKLTRGTRVLQYASAGLPIMVSTEKNTTELPGNDSPILTQHETAPFFEAKNYEGSKGEVVYIATKGLETQPGGKNQFPFGREPVLTLMSSAASQTLEEQKIVFEKVFKKWKGSSDQKEDFMLVGFRL